MRFHGDINANLGYSSFPEEWSCGEIVEFANPPEELGHALFQGQCTGPGGVTGSFSVEVTDNGTPQSAAGDIITVQTPAHGFLGAPCTADGNAYSNSGVIGGDNIVSHSHKNAGSSARKKG